MIRVMGPGRLHSQRKLSSTPEPERLKLGKAGLAPHLQQSVYTSKGLRPKPNPDVLLVAAESLGVEPSSCIMIEDSAIGVAAAKSAGSFIF